MVKRSDPSQPQVDPQAHTHQKVQIDTQRLWELAQEGKSVDEMMQALNIRSRDALKNALQEAMREKGETVVVPGLIDQPAIYARYTRDGIRIDPAMLEGTGFREGDEFDVVMEEGGIQLRRK